jgi:hypothetical protein
MVNFNIKVQKMIMISHGRLYIIVLINRRNDALRDENCDGQDALCQP